MNERPTWCHRLKPAKRTPPKTSRTKNSNTQRTENKTTDVVIQQHSRKLLKMDILMSETCWAHNKWNKIASDIKLVFHSSTIATMHGPINIKILDTSFILCKILCVHFSTVGWDSSVDIATRYGLNSPGIEYRCRRDFMNPSIRALGPTQPAIQGVPIIPGVKRRGHGINYPPHLAPRLKNE